MPAGTAPRPTIHRHPPCRWKKPAPIPYAMTWPKVIITTLKKQLDSVKGKVYVRYIYFKTTILPRWRVGDNSWICKGAMHAAKPTPTPTKNRPPIWYNHWKLCMYDLKKKASRPTMLQTLWQTAWPIAPPINIISAMPKTGRRPIRSERMPAARPPNKAPNVVAEVINSYIYI